MQEENIVIPGGLNGIIQGEAKRGAVIITHGAGQGMSAAILQKTAFALADLGFIVLRFNFSYLDRESAPSFGGKKELPELQSVITFMKKHGKPILIGKSFGARVCANAAVEDEEVRALVFYGMPLQGASKTSKPRDWSHLARIQAPMLFITGDKDQLCPLDQLSGIVSGLTAPVTSKVVPGDHSFKPKSEDRAVEICAGFIDDLKSDT